MKRISSIIFLTILSIPTISCRINSSLENSLSGKYQSQEENLGIDFLVDGNAVLHGDWGGTMGQGIAAEYEIIEGENSLNLKIDDGTLANVLELDLDQESIVLSSQGFSAEFVKVDEFSLELPQAIRANEAEAKTYIGSMNRSQQAYQIEYRSFSERLEDLGVAIQPETDSYRYTSFSDGVNSAFNLAEPKRERLRAVVGGVFLTNSNETLAIMCQSEEPQRMPELPYFQNGKPHCADGSRQL